MKLQYVQIQYNRIDLAQVSFARATIGNEDLPADSVEFDGILHREQNDATCEAQIQHADHKVNDPILFFLLQLERA